MANSILGQTTRNHYSLSPASGLTKRQYGKDRLPFPFAHRDLYPGEQAATALEANLTNLENRLDALLAAFEYPEEPLATADEPATAKNNEPKKDHDAAGHTGESNGLKKAEGPEDPAKKP
ncbi:hypothetical protein C8034_v006983 [Colletotrichum sidae]|uniref:Uncharacterized protein n=1 Tax=Colletotrichum sidae TaxID=1347389 RepID=A0A4R8T4V2_9PEZI|nr:hypothetical protein C8034_v006983 [Colletotrichum sidae]